MKIESPEDSLTPGQRQLPRIDAGEDGKMNPGHWGFAERASPENSRDCNVIEDDRVSRAGVNLP